MKESSKMKNKIIKILIILFFVAGLSFLLYPYITNLINTKIQSEEINKYHNIISEFSLEKCDKDILDAQEYNKTLVNNTLAQNQENVKNSNYYELLSNDESGIMGYLAIDKINVKLPIYHGSDKATLQAGIGHLEGSSLPVEGESTHTVLLGHTGLTSSRLLTDLIKMEEGDTFRITVLNKIYTYTVDQILVVKPDEMDALEIENGKQYVTIVTCTPYGSNTHRLLVRGSLQKDNVEISIFNEAQIIDCKIEATCVLIFSVLIIVVLLWYNNKCNNKQTQGE